MRRFLTLSVFAVVAPLLLGGPQESLAANLDAKPVKKARVHHKRVQVVRDYDGTAVTVTRTRAYVVRASGGAIVVMDPVYVHRPVYAEPGVYLNGQPVRPHAKPRSTYRQYRQYFTYRS